MTKGALHCKGYMMLCTFCRCSTLAFGVLLVHRRRCTLAFLRWKFCILKFVCLPGLLWDSKPVNPFVFAGEAWKEWRGGSSRLRSSLWLRKGRFRKVEAWAQIIYWEGNQICHPVIQVMIFGWRLFARVKHMQTLHFFSVVFAAAGSTGFCFFG